MDPAMSAGMALAGVRTVGRAADRVRSILPGERYDETVRAIGDQPPAYDWPTDGQWSVPAQPEHEDHDEDDAEMSTQPGNSRKSAYTLVLSESAPSKLESESKPLVLDAKVPLPSRQPRLSNSPPRSAHSSALSTRVPDENDDTEPPEYGLPPRYNQIPMLDSLAKAAKKQRDRALEARGGRSGDAVNEANRLYRHACIDVSFGRAQFLRVPLPHPPIRLNLTGEVVLWSPETETDIHWKSGFGALEELYCAEKTKKNVLGAEEYTERVGEGNEELPNGGCSVLRHVGHFYEPELPPPPEYGRKADDVSMEAAYWYGIKPRDPDRYSSLERHHRLGAIEREKPPDG